MVMPNSEKRTRLPFARGEGAQRAPRKGASSIRKKNEDTAMRKRSIGWRVSTDEKAKARVKELRIEGGVSQYLENLVLDDWEEARRRGGLT
jgi:hypothetical protein